MFLAPPAEHGFRSAVYRKVREGGAVMPAVSKAQQKAAGAALAAKRGEVKVSELKGASKDMYKSMSEAQLEEFASTRRKSLPRKKQG